VPPPGVRLLDLAGAIGGLLVSLPLWPVIALAIKLDSRGPVLHRGARLGAGEVTFEMLKFRSMRPGAEAGAEITVAGDERITRVGKVLRATKLDEIPQLVNVLRGEMSLVGPRPESPRYLPHYPAELRAVLGYRPGITSPASLRYRYEERLLGQAGDDPERLYIDEVLPRKAALDLEYCRTRTVRSDLVVLLRTARSIARSGAEKEGQQEGVSPEAPLVVAVTASVPFSDHEEAFVQDELTAVLLTGAALLVVPMRTHRPDPNQAARTSGLADHTRGLPLLSPRILAGALTTLARRPRRSLRAVTGALLQSGGLRNLGVNLLSVPKALWLAGVVRRTGAAHLHAYWLSHTATAAMVAAEIEGIPWSGTGYRWDIDIANALPAKLRSAAFVRCADELGLGRLTAAAATVAEAAPVVLIRTGVALPDRSAWSDHPVQPLVLACPAAFVEKKGHAVLVRAVRQLVDDHPGIRLHFFGDGPLRSDIERQVEEAGFGSSATFHGTVPLEEFRGFLRQHRPTCVLPSIRTADGQEEGIPVTLVEALANGAPVVSTRSGSIETLILDGCGLLVTPGDAEALAAALAEVMDDPAAAAHRCDTGYKRLLDEFDLEDTAGRMVALQTGSRRP
jgi:lipopolysaccharide/colanic/teichoic acid biosynthesis glycosyltransferase/glycosyltransferase involved in cell wall biosynthesis